MTYTLHLLFILYFRNLWLSIIIKWWKIWSIIYLVGNIWRRESWIWWQRRTSFVPSAYDLRGVLISWNVVVRFRLTAIFTGYSIYIISIITVKYVITIYCLLQLILVGHYIELIFVVLVNVDTHFASFGLVIMWQIPTAWLPHWAVIIVIG